MRKKLDQVLVVDLEATCWEGAPPEGQQSEIIEIGLCVLDVSTGDRLEKTSILVRPERSKVSAFCTQLTTLTQEQVDQGVPLEEACNLLRKQYNSQERVWASFGDYDRKQMERQCALEQIPYPFGRTHLNVKALSALFLGFPEEVGMSEVLKKMNLALEGTHHRGADDAWNIAGIFSTFLKRQLATSASG